MDTFFLVVVTVIVASSLSVRENFVIRGFTWLVLAALITAIAHSL
jgi:hypothetical protein